MGTPHSTYVYISGWPHGGTIFMAKSIEALAKILTDAYDQSNDTWSEFVAGEGKNPYEYYNGQVFRLRRGVLTSQAQAAIKGEELEHFERILKDHVTPIPAPLPPRREKEEEPWKP